MNITITHNRIFTLCKLCFNYSPVRSFRNSAGPDGNIRSQNKKPDCKQSGPNFFVNRTQSGLEYIDRTVLQFRLDQTVGPYNGPVPKFGTGLLTNQSGPVRSQSHGPVRPV